MALLGELQVNLVANSKKLVDGFKKAGKQTKTFVQKSVKQLKKYRESLLNIAGGVGAGLGVLGVMTKNLAAAGAENVRFANTLGLTLQQLEAMQSGAKRVNVNVDAMNDGLRELSKRSAEATTGTGSMFDALEMMNINVEKFSRMKLWDQYGLITKELDNLDDVARRNFLTDEIFGGTFADVATGLEGSIKGLADQFVRLGKGTSEGAGKSIVALDEDIKELTGSLTRMGKGFLISIAPLAIEAVKGLEVMFESLGLISGVKGGKPTVTQDLIGGFLSGSTQAGELVGSRFNPFGIRSAHQRAISGMSDQQIMERQVRVMEQTRDAILRQQSAEPALLN